MNPSSQTITLPASPATGHKPQLAEIRKDYYRNRYVLLSTNRAARPNEFNQEDPGLNHTHTPDDCKDVTDQPSVFELDNIEGGWQIKVVKNLFPSLGLDNPRAFGTQEVLLETPRHDIEFSGLSDTEIAAVIESYAARIKDLSQIKGVKFVSVFKNNGHLAGASRKHLHSQIAAIGIIPPAVAEEQIAYRTYHQQHQRCPVCDIVEWEVKQQSRIVADNPDWLVIAPYSSRKRYEVWLIPKRHFASLTSSESKEQHSAAQIIKQLTSKLQASQIDFNYFLEEPAVGQTDHHFTWRLEPVPRTPRAGFEFSTGLIINSVFPEEVPAWYKS